MNDLIDNWTADVLRHTSNAGRYVTDEKRVIALAEKGLLYDHGPQRLAAGAHYLVMTGKGREALNAWSAAQPKPVVKKQRRVSREFGAWRRYCEANRRLGFREFHQEVWPLIKCDYFL